MLSKHMESERKLRLNRNMNIKINKDAEIVIPFNQFVNYPSKKSKRFRSAFTTEQVNYLENEFKKFPYIGSANRKEIADILNISERAVKIWFQNRRMREKKENGNKDMIDQNKSNVELVKGQLHNDHNFETRNGSSSKQSQISEYSHSKKFNIDIPNQNGPIEVMCLSSQNKLKHPEDLNTPQKNTKCKSSIDKQIRQVCVNQFTNPSHKVQQNTSIHSTPPPLKESPCAYYENFKNEFNYQTYLNSTHLNTSQSSDIPQDLSSKTKLAQKAAMPNQPYTVSVHLNSDQKYVPFYTQNYCTSSLPIGAAVTAGLSIPSVSTVSPGNIVWKPLSVLPGPGLSPFGIPHSNELSVNNQNAIRGNCNCNCHEPSQGLSSIGRINQDPRTQPHYILAIPLNSGSNKM
ncbi:unnamed protein product, partial [Brenthis ino]